jgi:uncharacterized protein YjiS (DUF1127 family)
MIRPPSAWPGFSDTFQASLRHIGLQTWRQAIETQRARQHLMELDDHLLDDIGLTRADVLFGDFESVGRQRLQGRLP